MPLWNSHGMIGQPVKSSLRSTCPKCAHDQKSFIHSTHFHCSESSLLLSILPDPWWSHPLGIKFRSKRTCALRMTICNLHNPYSAASWRYFETMARLTKSSCTKYWLPNRERTLVGGQASWPDAIGALVAARAMPVCAIHQQTRTRQVHAEIRVDRICQPGEKSKDVNANKFMQKYTQTHLHMIAHVRPSKHTNMHAQPQKKHQHYAFDWHLKLISAFLWPERTCLREATHNSTTATTNMHKQKHYPNPITNQHEPSQ